MKMKTASMRHSQVDLSRLRGLAEYWLDALETYRDDGAGLTQGEQAVLEAVSTICRLVRYDFFGSYRIEDSSR